MDAHDMTLIHELEDLVFEQEEQEECERPSGSSSRPAAVPRLQSWEAYHHGASAEEAEDDGGGPSHAAAGSPGSSRASLDSARESEPGDMTCAICLHTIQLEELAMVKGCDHMYCAKCILEWSMHKEEPWCPQCKQPFNYLLTYRTLDGTLQDFPAEESVTLLKRARWFEDHLRVSEKGKQLVEESRTAEENAWQEYADDFELAEDEEIEAYYFSSAAGRARVVLENRRFGAGGYLSSGRRHARPTPGGPRRGGGKAAKSGEHAVVGTPPAARPPSFSTPNANGGRKARPTSAGVPAAPGSASRAASISGSEFGTSPSGSGMVYGSSPSGSGRRARRNAKRAAMDAALQQLGFAAQQQPSA